MLPQTRYAVDDLKKAGLKRKQFRVRSPWDRKVQGYLDTHIVLLCPYQELEPFIPNLAQYFKTVVSYLDGKPWHVSVSTTGSTGLYLWNDGQVTKVRQQEERRFVQPPLWNVL